MRPVALRKQSRAFLHNHDVPLAPIHTLGLEHLGVETYDHSVVATVQTRLRVGDAAVARLCLSLLFSFCSCVTISKS